MLHRLKRSPTTRMSEAADGEGPASSTTTSTMAENGYHAFISYSHAADGQLAPALQRGLHRLAKPWYRLPTIRAFRDTTSLSATPALWPSIEDALASCSFFILLASPEAAASPWVQREVEWWREHGASDRLLIVLTGGQIAWDADASDFDWGVTTALPSTIEGEFNDEPAWVDLSWAASGEECSLRHARFRDCVADLAAPLHGVAKEQLVGEDIRQQRRTAAWRNAAILGLATLALIASLLGYLATVQRNEAARQRDNATRERDEAARQRDIATAERNEARAQRNRAEARQITATAVANVGTRLDVAQLLAAEGYERDRSVQSAAGLFRAVTDSPHAARFATNGARVTALTPVSAARGVVTGGSDGGVRVWDMSTASTGPPIGRLRQAVTAVAASRSGRTVAAGDTTGRVVIIGSSTGQTRRVRTGAAVDDLALDRRGRWLAILSDDGHVTVYDLTSDRVHVRTQVDGAFDVVGIEGGGRVLVLGSLVGPIERRDLRTLERISGPTGYKVPAGNFTPTYSSNRAFFGFDKFGVRAVDTKSETDMLFYPTPSDGALASAVALADDASLAAVASGGTISVVQPRPADMSETSGPRYRRPTLTGEFGGLVAEPLPGVSSTIDKLEFVGDSGRLVSSSGSLLTMWDIDQQALIAKRLPAALKDTASATSRPGLAVSADGQHVAWSNDRAGVVDARTGRRLFRTREVRGAPLALTAVSELMVDSQLRVWDVHEQARGPVQVAQTVRHEAGADLLEPIPGTDDLVVGWYDGAIDRLNAVTGELTPLADAPSDVVLATAVSTDRDFAYRVTGGNDGAGPLAVHRVDLFLGGRVRELDLDIDSFAGLAVSQDGHYLFISDGTDDIVVWDADTQGARRLPAERIEQIVVTADGARLAALTAEGLLSVWDVPSSTKLGDVMLRERTTGSSPDAGSETAMRFSQDGNVMYTATVAGALLRWEMAESGWLAAVCESTGRSLTDNEWSRFIGTEGGPRFSCEP